jgi:hypothetical protein
MCMFMCVCMCEYMCLFVYLSVYIQSARVCACVCVCVCVYVDVYLCTVTHKFWQCDNHTFENFVSFVSIVYHINVVVSRSKGRQVECGILKLL